MLPALIAFRCPCDRQWTLLSENTVGQAVRCSWSGARFVVPAAPPFGAEKYRVCQDATLRKLCLGAAWRKAGPRKRRLLVCAAARSRATGRIDERVREALEDAERHAEGPPDRPPWDHRLLTDRGAWQGPDAAVLEALAELPRELVRSAHEWPFSVLHWEVDRLLLLEELIGNPFLDPPAAPLWRTGEVLRLAEALAREALFADLPVLADALEEAGCVEEELLAHLRGGGPHYRGCWALDGVLGRGLA